MGADGGTIPTRYELIKLKKPPEKKDKESIRMYKWAHCALSQRFLTKPVVACEMGKLYNKEAIIELLLSEDRSQAPSWIDHIQKMKDVVELELTPNPSYTLKRKDATGDNMYEDKLCAMFMCPITGLEMNGKFHFYFHLSTGKVVSERAIKVLQKDPEELSHYMTEDLILLNPVDEEIDEQEVKMLARRAKAKAERKAAKVAKKTSSSVGADDAFKKPSLPMENSDQSLTDEPLAKKAKTDDTAKAFKDQGKGKKSKKEPEESVYRMGDIKAFNPFAEQYQKEQKADALPAREGPKVKKADHKADLKKVNTTSIQEGNKSEVFKKLFTTHKSAQNLPKGNWVTFDPRYHFG
jgi:hypothetical protein